MSKGAAVLLTADQARKSLIQLLRGPSTYSLANTCHNQGHRVAAHSSKRQCKVNQGVIQVINLLATAQE